MLRFRSAQVASPHNEEGFSLILVAILLVVAAIVATTALQQSTRDTFWNPRVETQQKLVRIEEAIELFKRQNGYFPCPAIPTLAQSSSSHGTSNGSPCSGGGTLTTSIGGETVRIGTVPYRTLQLQADAAVDGWGNKITYAVNADLTAAYTGETGTIRINGPSGSVSTNAAFVLISHGPDGRGSYRNFSGNIAVACTSSAGLDQENCDADGIFYTAPLNINPGNAAHYDDQNVWTTEDFTGSPP